MQKWGERRKRKKYDPLVYTFAGKCEDFFAKELSAYEILKGTRSVALSSSQKRGLKDWWA